MRCITFILFLQDNPDELTAWFDPKKQKSWNFLSRDAKLDFFKAAFNIISSPRK